MIIDIPNGSHGSRRDEVTGVILHAVGEWVVDATNLGGKGIGYIWHCTDWLRAIGRSCHVFALPDGRGVREVDSWYQAWHAKGRNRHWAGIEFVLPGVWPYSRFKEAMRGLVEAAYTDEQLDFGLEWVRARSQEHGFFISRDTVTTHHLVDPERKLDPGAIFPYEAFLDKLV